MKGQLLAALGLVISAGSFFPANAGGVPLSCGVTQHDMANSLRVTNSTTSSIAKTRPIKWATPQENGTIRLTSSLAPGQSVFASIGKNSGPSCIASYEDGVILTPRHSGPILTPRH